MRFPDAGGAHGFVTLQHTPIYVRKAPFLNKAGGKQVARKSGDQERHQRKDTNDEDAPGRRMDQLLGAVLQPLGVNGEFSHNC